jgi:CHAT domain-containing protein
LNYQSHILYHYNPNDKIRNNSELIINIHKNIDSTITKELATSYYYLSQYYFLTSDLLNAEIYMKNSLGLRMQLYDSSSSFIGYCLMSLGNIYNEKEYLLEAKEYYNKALDLFNSQSPPNHHLIGDIYYSLGIVQINYNNYDRSLLLLNLAIIEHSKLEYFIADDAIIYYSIAKVYFGKRNYLDAIPFLKKAESDYLRRSESKELLGPIYDFHGLNLLKTGKYKEAIIYIKKANSIYEKFPKIYTSEILLNKLNEAYCQNMLGKFIKSDLIIRDIHNSKIYNTKIDSLTKANALYKIAMIQFRRKLFDSAINTFLKSLNLYKIVKGERDVEVLLTNNNIGNIFLEINNLEKSLLFYKTSYRINTGHDFCISNTDLVYHSSEIHSLSLLIDSLIGIGKSYYHLSNKYNSKVNRKNCILAFRLANRLFIESKKETISYISKLENIDNRNELFDIAIKSIISFTHIDSGQEFDSSQAFQFMESYKAGLLMETLNHNDAINSVILTNSLKIKERDLKIDITFYNNKLNEENSKQNPDSARITYYENVLFDFNREYEALIDTLENKYPDYYDLKHRNYVASVDDVQKELLDDNAALVEYYYSDSAMYAFAITKNDYEVYELGVPKHFKQWLSNFRKAQTDARFLLDSATTANQLYFSSGHALYKHLLQPVLADLDSGITNLIIVPDGELGHINFETLLTDSVGSSSGSYADLPYLLKDYNIQYAYSATVLLSAKRHKRKAPAAFFAGFAPNYANLATTVAGDSSADQMVVELTRSGNYQLPGAISEVENLAALTGGDAFINAAASERAFKQNADRYQVLHLAMHGLVNDRDAMYSKLLFTQTEDTLEDNYLNAAEIFNLDLSADLVVLSACNTGYGQVNRGEGIMSLSRAFKYAGSPSLVMSLWQIPDQPTSAIMNRFYENLMEGQRKDVALRNAKLDFLNANRGNLRSHPFYWAGLIPIGDMQPLAVESWAERNMLLLAGLLLLLIAAVMAGRRFSKQ